MPASTQRTQQLRAPSFCPNQEHPGLEGWGISRLWQTLDDIQEQRKRDSLDENINGIKVQVGLQREMRKRQQRENKKVESGQRGWAGDVFAEVHVHRVEFRPTARHIHRRRWRTFSSRQPHNAHGPRRC